MIEDWTLDELVAAHAAGRLPPPLALIIGSHLALSPESRAAHDAFEAAGGVLLEQIEPAPLGPGAWERLAQRLADPAPATCGSVAGGSAPPPTTAAPPYPGLA